MSTDISHRSNWQAPRKPGVDDRKNNFAKTGEMLVGGLGRVTSSDLQKPFVNDFPLDSKKPATMKYGGSMLENEPFQIENKNSRKILRPNLQEENYQQMNNNLHRDLNQIDKALSQKTKALEKYNNNYEPSSVGYSGSSQQFQPRDFAKPQLLTSKTEQKQELYSSPNNDEFADFSPNNIPSRIPKNTLNSTRSKLTQSNNSTSDDFGFQFNKPKLSKNTMEDESPTLSNYPSRPTFEVKLQPQQAVPDKPKLFEGSAQKNKLSEATSLPKLNNTAKAALITPQEDKAKEKEKDQDYNKAFSKPSFKKAATLTPAQREANNKKARGAKIPNEDIHQDRGPLKECPHGCGRSFAADALESHAKACQKVFQNKRKQFDSTQQRTTDELAQTMSGFGAKNGVGAKNKAGMTSDKWKQQSDALRAKIKAAKSPEELAKIQAIKEKEEVGEVKPCPHGCGRSFNESALEKHAKVCQKVFQNKRKQFDSTQQRMTDELAQTMGSFGLKKGQNENNKKDGKWKEQSEALRAKIKEAAAKK